MAAGEPASPVSQATPRMAGEADGCRGLWCPHGSQDPKPQDVKVCTCCALVLQDYRIEPCVFDSIEHHETRVEPACSALKSIPFDAYDYHLAETLQPWEAFLTANILSSSFFHNIFPLPKPWLPWLERSGEGRGCSKVRDRKEMQEGNTELQNLATSLRSAFGSRAGINMYTCNVSALGGRDRRTLWGHRSASLDEMEKTRISGRPQQHPLFLLHSPISLGRKQTKVILVQEWHVRSLRDPGRTIRKPVLSAHPDSDQH